MFTLYGIVFRGATKAIPYSVNITSDVQCTCIYAVGVHIFVKSNFYSMITTIAEKKTNDLKSHKNQS